MLDQYFDHVFYVNLDRREDRRERMEERMESIGCEEYERWPAVDGEDLEGNDEKLWQSMDWRGLDDNGDYVSRYEKGCYLSHLQLLKEARDRGYDDVLVLEDDAVFEHGFRRLWKRNWEQLPDSWDMLYPGANDQHIGEQVGENVYASNRMFTTHSYAVSGCFKGLIERLEHEKFHKAVDYTIAEVHPQLEVYVFKPHIIIQEEDFSDIDHEEVNYDSMIRDL